MSDDDTHSPTEWFVGDSTLETPHHPKRRKNRQRRNKARRQRQQAEQAVMGTVENEDQQKAQVEERKFPRDGDISWLDPEDEEGNIEYKLKIKDPNSIRFQQLVTQMKYRLSEGSGECYYCVGVADDGYPRGLPSEELDQSIDGVYKMAELLHAKAEIRWRFQGGYGQESVVIKVVRCLKEDLEAIDIRIGVIGGVDVGKSTLIACLTTGQDGSPCLDNGHGSARTNVLKHKHEIETGHTSSVNKHLLGFDHQGQILNYCGLSCMTPAEIGLAANRLVNLIDMGGHEKFLKTVLRGLTSVSPDYCLLCISSINGITSVTRRHLIVALALETPIIFLITKMDLASEETLQSIRDELRILGQLISNSTSMDGLYPSTPWVNLLVSTESLRKYVQEGDCLRIISNEDEAQLVAEELIRIKSQQGRDSSNSMFIAPVLCISTVTGDGLTLLLCLLNALQGLNYSTNKEVHFQIDQVFRVQGVGEVFSGLLVSGEISVGQHLQLGPDSNGDFHAVQVRSLQCSQVPIRTIRAGQTASISVRILNPSPSEDNSLMTDSSQDVDSSENTEGMHSIKEVSKVLRKIRTQCGKISSLHTGNELQGHLLLGVDRGITTVKTFEAVLVLLGGQWPARGLLSGRWPPTQLPDSDADSLSGSSAKNLTTSQRRSLSPSPSRKNKNTGCYQTVIYCRSTRQAAHVVSMEELSPHHSSAHLLPPSIRAAVSVAASKETEDEEDSGYCTARVVFLLQSNPEWLQLGEVLTVRDQTHGYLSGIGFITQI